MKLWLLLVLGLFFVMSYALRYLLMEEVQWVGICVADSMLWQCDVRALLGWLIHFQVLSLAALLLAVFACYQRHSAGVWLARCALCAAIPALVLYSATWASVAVVVAGLRLMRYEDVEKFTAPD